MSTTCFNGSCLTIFSTRRNFGYAVSFLVRIKTCLCRRNPPVDVICLRFNEKLYCTCASARGKTCAWPAHIDCFAIVPFISRRTNDVAEKGFRICNFLKWHNAESLKQGTPHDSDVFRMPQTNSANPPTLVHVHSISGEKRNVNYNSLSHFGST